MVRPVSSSAYPKARKSSCTSHLQFRTFHPSVTLSLPSGSFHRSSHAQSEGCSAGHSCVPAGQERTRCGHLSSGPSSSPARNAGELHQRDRALSRAVTTRTGSGSTKGIAAHMCLPTVLPPRSPHAQAAACFLQPFLHCQWQEQGVERGMQRGHIAPQRVTQQQAGSDPTHQETRGATAALCCMGQEHVLCDGSGMKPVWYWGVHQEKCILGAAPHKGCYHPTCPSLKGSFSMSHSDVSAVHFMWSLLHLGTVQSALDWTCVSRDQQSPPDEVGDASKPVAPSPALSFLFGLQPSHRCLDRVLLVRNTLSLPQPRKAKLSASFWSPLLPQQFASQHSYARLGIFSLLPLIFT